MKKSPTANQLEVELLRAKAEGFDCLRKKDAQIESLAATNNRLVGYIEGVAALVGVAAPVDMNKLNERLEELCKEQLASDPEE